jgi:hypothetical protein
MNGMCFIVTVMCKSAEFQQLRVYDVTVLQLQQLQCPAIECRHTCCIFTQQLDL